MIYLINFNLRIVLHDEDTKIQIQKCPKTPWHLQMFETSKRPGKQVKLNNEELVCLIKRIGLSDRQTRRSTSSTQIDSKAFLKSGLAGFTGDKG